MIIYEIVNLWNFDNFLNSEILIFLNVTITNI